MQGFSQFFSRDTADTRILSRQRNILNIIQSAEYVDLAQLAHACQKHELQIFLVGLHHTVEVMKNLAVQLLQFRFVVNVDNRAVILVDKYDYRLSGTVVNVRQKLIEAPIGRVVGI